MTLFGVKFNELLNNLEAWIHLKASLSENIILTTNKLLSRGFGIYKLIVYLDLKVFIHLTDVIPSVATQYLILDNIPVILH